MGRGHRLSHLGDGTPRKRRQPNQLLAAQLILADIPQLVEVRLPPRQERGHRARQRVTLPATPLLAALRVDHQRDVPVGDVVLLPLLDDSHAPQLPRQRLDPRALARFLPLGDAGLFVRVDAQGLAQAAELDDVGGEHGVGVAADDVRLLLHEEEGVGVEDEGDGLAAGGAEDARDGCLHERVAAEAGPGDEDVQAREEGGYGGGDLLWVGVWVLGERLGREMVRSVRRRLAHEWMHHEVGRIRFDHSSRCWSAYYMGLVDDVSWGSLSSTASQIMSVSELTMSQPSLALAMAEKYGAPV